MAESYRARSRGLAVGRRRGLAAAGLAVTLLVAVFPAFADTPETGPNPNVTLTVTPDDLVSNGQTVTVTGAGFPANTPGVIRQCGGSIAAPQCDLDVAATFVTTETGAIPPTSVTAKRIINTGTTGFNCGVQACALVATAGGQSSQHHISILGAGTIVPTSSPTSSSTSTTSATTTPTTVPPTTVPPTTVPPTTVPPTTTSTSLPPAELRPVCDVLRALLEPFPFLREILDALVAILGCPPVG